MSQKTARWISGLFSVGLAITMVILLYTMGAKGRQVIFQVWIEPLPTALLFSLVFGSISFLLMQWEAKKQAPPRCPTCNQELLEKKHLAKKTEIS